jgi:hypothetical protein
MNVRNILSVQINFLQVIKELINEKNLINVDASLILKTFFLKTR